PYLVGDIRRVPLSLAAPSRAKTWRGHKDRKQQGLWYVALQLRLLQLLRLWLVADLRSFGLSRFESRKYQTNRGRIALPKRECRYGCRSTVRSHALCCLHVSRCLQAHEIREELGKSEECFAGRDTA